MSLFEKSSCASEPCLFAGIEGQAIHYGAMIKGGQGILNRGSIMKEDDVTKTMSLIGEIPKTDNVVFVLGRTVDTGESGSEDVLSDVYAAGLFNREVIFLGTGIDLDAAGEEVLREKGIHLDSVVPSTGPVKQV